jgi:hypothetical protein
MPYKHNGDSEPTVVYYKALSCMVGLLDMHSYYHHTLHDIIINCKLVLLIQVLGYQLCEGVCIQHFRDCLHHRG